MSDATAARFTYRGARSGSLVAGITRRVRRVGLHLDEPDRFLAALVAAGAGEDAGRTTR